ncbi:DUF3419 family protein [Candidatus Woesearchaeota archaeon]|nr:DUF3419 family protein [Candidatus Woesearchaeota archaeon]
MVLNYEFGWADDPCDFTTEVVTRMSPKSILQVVGSGDHLLSFYAIPSVDKITAFDVDARALALLDLRLTGIKTLDYRTFTKFFNIYKFKEFVKGSHHHPILDGDNILDSESYSQTFHHLMSFLKDETRAVLLNEVEVDDNPGYHCINSFNPGARLANPAVLPWLKEENFGIIKNKSVDLKLHQASIDSFYGEHIGAIIGESRFDLIWPIDALDNNVDIFEFLNLCLKNGAHEGHVMIHPGIKDPYVLIEEGFPEIMNISHTAANRQRVEQRGHKPTLAVYLEDVFKKAGYVPRNDLVNMIRRYFPRETNTWWDLDLEESWSHTLDKPLKGVLMIYQKKEDITGVSADEFSKMMNGLPKYFRRGLYYASNTKGEKN